MRERIVVTGATGFLGRHLVPCVERIFGYEVVPLSSRDCDLMDFVATHKMIADQKPNVLIHLAALSGGIEINRRRPADFYFINTILTANVFEAAARAGVPRLIYTMGGCSYPNSAISPISEGQMWAGFPNGETAGYSMAKKMGIVAADCYRKQYGMKSTILVPGNMYGEYDNYDAIGSHVIPGLVRRFFEARRNCLPAVTLWGSGGPRRDFVYAGDVAACIRHFIEHADEPGPVNISTGTETSIRELAGLIATRTGYDGRIEWDAKKPDGQAVKIFDVGKLHALGLQCPTPLEAGLSRTVEWFASNYDVKGAVRL